MEWIKKYWIVPVVLLVVYIAYRLFVGNKKTTAGSDDTTNSNANLETNNNAFENWGVTYERPSVDSVLIKGQGNGNSFQKTFTRQELAGIAQVKQWEVINSYSNLDFIWTFEQTDNYGSVASRPIIPWEHVIKRESSTDGDFYISIILAGDSKSPAYLIVSVWDPSQSNPTDPEINGAKAALRINAITTSNPTTTILVAPSNFNSGKK